MAIAKRLPTRLSRTFWFVLIVTGVTAAPAPHARLSAQDQTGESVFSGPQIDEKLPPLKARGVFGDVSGKEFEVVGESHEKPVLLIFFHELTRPAFGLVRAVGTYAADRAKDGLKSSVIFLTDDPTKTEKWAKGVLKHLPEGVTYCISTDGKEGPGSYGLNRNVTLTILVARQGKVTANFALVQPQLQADGPRILQAIVDVTGGGKAPSIEQLLAGTRYGASQRMAAGGTRMNARGGQGRPGDAQLTSLLRAVINKQASESAVKKAAARVEEHVAQNEKARQELARIATTVVNSGKLSNYGTEPAQEILRGWVKKYGAASKDTDDPSEPPR